MPLVALALAWLTLMVGINGNYKQVAAQMQADLPGFFSLMVGILGIAAFFRLIDMPNAGRVFLVLVLIVYLMSNTQVLTSLENIGATSTAATPAASTASTGVATTAAATASGTGDATPLTTPAPGTA